MPLSEKARIEVYLPDALHPAYAELLEVLDREFTCTFGGCTRDRLARVAGAAVKSRASTGPDWAKVCGSRAKDGRSKDFAGLPQVVRPGSNPGGVAQLQNAIAVSA